MADEFIRKLLLSVSLKAGGDYNRIMDMILRRDFPPDDEIERADRLIKSGYVTYIDEEYPTELKRVYRPPIVLYYYGDLSLLYKEKEALAVVGARECTSVGRKITNQLVRDLAPDYRIVSGMAKGIDAVAHESALEVGGDTIAVLGSGIDYCYPIDNFDLYRMLKNRGLVISEYPNFTAPTQLSFPMRNRIIAALSKGVLITEAKKRSGTMITVDWAQSISKDIMCVPYRAEDDSGCNQLIKEGAFMVEDSDDVRLVLEGTKNLKKTLMWP